MLGLPPLVPVGGFAPATPFLNKQEVFRQSGRRFSACCFLTVIDISVILCYTETVLILIVQLVCHLLTILTEIYYEKEKNN
ncbi:MAG: hypothetical protein EGR80_07900 [Ruminiclostridium sp.]|nr:hypothetical protein [Ruminiclostridium sp.]